MRNVAPLWKVALACACVCMFATQANALWQNVTIWDQMGSSGENEDGTTEPGTVWGQDWDLEAMFLDGNTLRMVGGYDFVNGHYTNQAEVGTPDNLYTSGDIFISLVDPIYGNETPTAGGGQNSIDDWFYGYVIDVDWTNLTYQVYSSTGQTIQTVAFPSVTGGSNPWQILDGQSLTGLLPQAANVGVGAYANDGSGGNPIFAGPGTHYMVSFDLSWLDSIVGNGMDTWIHFTYECGNDNLMGKIPNFNPAVDNPVPEPASFGLLGLGLVALGAARLRAKRA